MSEKPPRGEFGLTSHGSVRRTVGEPVWTRSRLLLTVFFLLSVLLFCGCYFLSRPFFPALAWAAALAIVADPFYEWVSRRLHRRDLAAGLSVLSVGIIVVAPMVFLLLTLANQATNALQSFQSESVQETFGAAMEKSPVLAHFWERIEPRINSGPWIDQLSRDIGTWIKGLVAGSVWAGMNLLISFFLLFYFWRDRLLITDFLRSVLPLSTIETDQVFARVRDTVFASIYGTLAVAAVQGTLGGLMFWWLGLPAPLLWGVVMGLLSIIPVLGAFVIWVPAAVFLAAQGSWGKTVILVFWGTIVIGLVDNLLYPVLVGKRIRLHTVPVFMAIVGGLIVFGASGLVLGPVILALADAALEIWRCRTSPNKSAETPC